MEEGNGIGGVGGKEGGVGAGRGLVCGGREWSWRGGWREKGNKYVGQVERVVVIYSFILIYK